MEDAIYVLFNNISVILAQWFGENEKLYAMEPLFTVRKISASSESRTRGPISVGPRLHTGLFLWGRQSRQDCTGLVLGRLQKLTLLNNKKKKAYNTVSYIK